MKIKIKSTEPLHLEDKGILVYLVSVINKKQKPKLYLASISLDCLQELENECTTKETQCCIINRAAMECTWEFLETSAAEILDSPHYHKDKSTLSFEPYKGVPIFIQDRFKFWTYDPLETERFKKHGFWHELFLDSNEYEVWF